LESPFPGAGFFKYYEVAREVTCSGDLEESSKAVVLFMLVPLACAAFASVSIHGLALSSVQVVNAHDQAELPRPGDLGRILARMVGDPAVQDDPIVAKISARSIAERPMSRL
jgi:hypothetical protein